MAEFNHLNLVVDFRSEEDDGRGIKVEVKILDRFNSILHNLIILSNLGGSIWIAPSEMLGGLLDDQNNFLEIGVFKLLER